MEIRIEEQAWLAMKAHAEVAFPNECCGFMYGSDDGVRKITVTREVQNSKEGDQRRRFEISSKDYMKAEHYALENNLVLLGVYHSHPQHPAIPSEHDRKQALPWFSYVILSVMNGETDHIRSWQLNERQNFDEETIHTQANTVHHG